MSKKEKTAYDHITPELVAQVKDVIADSVKHLYSASKVYGAHNAVFKRKDQPQTCSSCNRNRVRDLKRWIAEYEKEVLVFADTANGQDETDEVKPQIKGVAIGVVRIPLKDGAVPIDLTPTNEAKTKGKVLYADGTAVKPGSYETATGDTVVVQPGGKANFKKNEEEDLT